jgi:hypothetical protein
MLPGAEAAGLTDSLTTLGPKLALRAHDCPHTHGGIEGRGDYRVLRRLGTKPETSVINLMRGFDPHFRNFVRAVPVFARASIA